jgi:hypothetical protein
LPTAAPFRIFNAAIEEMLAKDDNVMIRMSGPVPSRVKLWFRQPMTIQVIDLVWFSGGKAVFLESVWMMGI